MKSYLNNHFDPTKLVEVFDELPLWSAPFGLKLLDYVNYKKNCIALDIGCGAGFPLTELAMRLGAGSKVYGIDPWKEAMLRAQKKIEFYEIQNVELIDGTAEIIPLPDHSLDLITSNNGINNIEDIETVYGECFRVLKSGGQFIQTMNTDRSMMEFYDILEEVLTEMRLVDSITSMKKHIYDKRKPIGEILGLLEKYQFECKEMVSDEFHYKFSSGTAMLNHYFIRLAFMDSWIKLLPENRVEEIFTEVELRMNAIAEIQGFFKLTIPLVLFNSFK